MLDMTLPCMDMCVTRVSATVALERKRKKHKFSLENSCIQPLIKSELKGSFSLDVKVCSPNT